MSFWDGATQITADNMARLGPDVDGFVGTDGKYSVLNDAIAAGWTRIIVTTGATLNADLNLTAKCSIVSRIYQDFTLTGNYCINVQANNCYLEGFRMVNGAGIGIYVTGARARLARITVESCLSHGIHFNAASGDHELIMCNAYGNGGDGIRMEASNSARLVLIRSQSNVGYGVNDLTDVVQITCSKINGNTAGNINGASTYIDTSVIAP